MRSWYQVRSWRFVIQGEQRYWELSVDGRVISTTPCDAEGFVSISENPPVGEHVEIQCERQGNILNIGVLKAHGSMAMSYNDSLMMANPGRMTWRPIIEPSERLKIEGLSPNAPGKKDDVKKLVRKLLHESSNLLGGLLFFGWLSFGFLLGTVLALLITSAFTFFRFKILLKKLDK